MQAINDETYMRLALQMAEQVQGQTGINPAVGCVIVKDGRIVGLGAHLKRGEPHAEVHALNMAGAHAAGSTVYVTLEPCSHYGLTPPCSDRLIAEKVRRVVIAAVDPNPRVSGSGVRRLRENGLEVETGLLEKEADALNEAFRKHILTGLPFVSMKTASTLDGRIASRTGDSRWITNESAREFVHVLRHKHQAVMVGVNTVLADNPKLTTRLSVPGLNPIRIVADSRLQTPETAEVLADPQAKTILLATAAAPEDKRRRLEELGAEVLVCGDGEKVDLRAAMRLLGQKEIGSILLEGGGRLNGAMLEAGLVDKVYLFFAPKIIGGFAAPSNIAFSGFERMADAIRLEEVRYEQFGDNFCVIGRPRYADAGDEDYGEEE
ncbi:bifunctional diaminohydroxyphosphoribosylaminopyrimidine deaminase/5-amino-6-(5-phosphoribosylamino)uracil reductase RibD [Ferviditalea candida]|uniref:Riboflavin biosynthesis protein RibD n=1 Tax=Ferviditalea candida TaxID=3108399 RepID=A0ABU5ZKP9_9BACL|nr:bifunctional diaminohydroxyphosphoribosylaminopyrimidine deaminase/5-amino-6-(5-phosphoribosylamino)uracil reductase RibD [Paenibacillaceae bacterium T2]